MNQNRRPLARFHILELEEIDMELIDMESPLRAEAESFARDCYRRFYGANLSHFCEELLLLRSNHRGIISCIGLAHPSARPFFLEQYLDRPVEDEISDLLGRRVHRGHVVEIGTMATAHSGLCRLTMIGLAGLLKERGIDYIAFTGIKTLRNTLAHLGIDIHRLKAASAERLSGDASVWGSYYRAAPEVVFMDVGTGLIQLENVIAALNGELTAMGLLMKALLKKGAVLEKGMAKTLKDRSVR